MWKSLFSQAYGYRCYDVWAFEERGMLGHDPANLSYKPRVAGPLGHLSEQSFCVFMR